MGSELLCGEVKILNFRTLVGYPGALSLGEHLGIEKLGYETDKNTKVTFKHIEEGGYRFIEITMEI